MKDDIPFDYFFDKPTNDLTPNEANIFEKEKSLNRTCKVGSYRPNRLGLFDMHGNVYELCDDRTLDGGIAPRVLRGGAWSFGGGFSRAANPYTTGSAIANPAHGLRVARVPIAAHEPPKP